jgi:hypothetical protein
MTLSDAARSVWAKSHEAGAWRPLWQHMDDSADIAGNGCYARKVAIACKRERARRLHTVAPMT